jgi:hypothetical protein
MIAAYYPLEVLRLMPPPLIQPRSISSSFGEAPVYVCRPVYFLHLDPESG